MEPLFVRIIIFAVLVGFGIFVLVRSKSVADKISSLRQFTFGNDSQRQQSIPPLTLSPFGIGVIAMGVISFGLVISAVGAVMAAMTVAAIAGLQ